MENATMTISTDALELVTEAGANVVWKAIARMEGVTKLTVKVLRGMGLCTASSVMLADCTTGREKAAARREVVDESN